MTKTKKLSLDLDEFTVMLIEHKQELVRLANNALEYSLATADYKVATSLVKSCRHYDHELTEILVLWFETQLPIEWRNKKNRFVRSKTKLDAPIPSLVDVSSALEVLEEVYKKHRKKRSRLTFVKKARALHRQMNGSQDYSGPAAKMDMGFAGPSPGAGPKF